MSILGVYSPVKALSPVFESTAAAKVTLGSLASRTQCAVLGKQGIGPYTMTGTDASSNSSYSYVTDKNYTQTEQLYEGQESPTQTLSYTTSTGQTYSGRSGVIRLQSSGQISYGNTCNGHGTFGSAFGPEVWTEPFPATANQSISFDWAAAGGWDDYEAYGYLVQVSASGNTYDYGSSATSTLVSYGRGQNQGWVTSTGVVPSNGYYRFRFVNGSYDATGGKALGASMYIDSAISVASANTITFAQPADIVTSSSNQTFTVSATATSGLSVTFTSITTGKCTVGSSTDSGGTSTATVTVLASQTGTCTISANSSSNNSYVAAATVSQSFTLVAGSTAPTTSGGTSMSGTVASGNTLTAVDGTWGDGGAAITATTYQWQSCTPASCTWTNISGATSSTYVIISDDVAKQIRVAVTKTNSIGSLTANSAASITVTAAYLNAVTNLTAVANADGSVDLDWDASAASNTAIYAYSVSFYDLTVIGGATSGGWGVWTNQGTNYSLSTGMFSGSNPVTTGYGPVRFGIKAGNQSCFSNAGVGPCVYGPEVTVDATVVDPTPVTTTSSTTTTSTTTTSTTTTTTTIAVPVYVPPVVTTTVYVPPVVVIPPVDTGTTSTSVVPVVVTPPNGTTVPLPQYPEPETESTTVTLPVGTLPGIELPAIVIPPVGTEPGTVVVIIPSDEVTLPEAGEAISTGELAGILDTAFTPGASTEEMTEVLDGLLDADLTGKQFDAVVDATLGSLDEPGADVGAVIDSFLGADLSDKEFTKVLDAVFSEDVSDEVFTEALTTMLDAELSDKEFDKVLDAAFSKTTSPEAMVSALSSIFDGPASGGDISKVMGAVFDEDISAEDTKAVLGDLLQTTLSKSEAEAVFDNVFDSDLSDAETIDLIVDVLKDELTAELLGSVLGAVFDEEVSTEVLVETFTAVLGNELNAESVGVIVDVLESESITNNQVSQVVDLIVSQDGGVNSDQATELATSAKVLESIDSEQATAVFDAVVVAEVSEEAGAQIAEALADAPTDVKESFEEEINVFAGVFDTYVALGSKIDVGDRRTVLAVGAATAIVGAIGASGALSPSSGPNGPSSGTGSSSGGSGGPASAGGDVAARRNEEEEMSGEIAWDGLEWIKNMSIFRYNSGVRVLDWGMAMKKFSYGLINLGFTISGSLIVYLTLSGSIQKIAGISSALALVGALYLHMKEPE